MTVELHMGDCLEIMHTIPDASVDMILADLPYGTTACKWDTVIDLPSLWSHYKRVTKRNGAIVLTASQPFTSALVMSNPKWFKWADVWHKSHARGHLNAKIMPMREHEDILIFGQGRVTYNPQLQPKNPANVRPVGRRAQSDCYGAYNDRAERDIPTDVTYPRSVLYFKRPDHDEWGMHPTQKPVALMEYLIRTYTNEGETVLDNTMGSGTTGVACVNTNRSFIGIEKDEGYFQIATERIEKAANAFKQAELIGA